MANQNGQAATMITYCRREGGIPLVIITPKKNDNTQKPATYFVRSTAAVEVITISK